jgi:hypothetical protein
MNSIPKIFVPRFYERCHTLISEHFSVPEKYIDECFQTESMETWERLLSDRAMKYISNNPNTLHKCVKEKFVEIDNSELYLCKVIMQHESALPILRVKEVCNFSLNLANLSIGLTFDEDKIEGCMVNYAMSPYIVNRLNSRLSSKPSIYGGREDSIFREFFDFMLILHKDKLKSVKLKMINDYEE